ncbi:YolD-like family protein [Staphylococcus xylosus]|uniref:YolD-like family protein n=1 Tax=Staphylococcus xylosus TaxID=1288 RepID=UPI002DB5D622|nr:YolD-like family protein [Staphylococcus xylosus]MEB8070175.1 YolD-like family protein [Staphylococcus xylosus]
MKVINPNGPDEYKYETDYRNIPREYLNPHIPVGRGIVKWQAFKTLPEQYEQLEQYIQDQNKIDRPSIELRYFVDGYIKEKEGCIHKVDTYTQTLHLDEETGLSKINLLDIVAIK